MGDDWGRLAAILGPGHAVGGITFIPANIAEPGVIAHIGDKTGLTFGEADGAASPRLTAFRDACRAAGLEAEVSPDIDAVLNEVRTVAMDVKSLGSYPQALP